MSNLLEVKDRVQRHLVELVGDVQVREDGRYSFEYGSTRMFVAVTETADGETTFVRMLAPIAFEVPLSPGLYEWVARQSGMYRFGHIECLISDEEQRTNLLFVHTLLGDYLDAQELRVAVGAVVKTADDLDEDVVAKFGGKRYEDS